MRPVFDSKFFEEAWPAISRGLESEANDESELRLCSAHALLRMLRPERWAQVELFGGLDCRPFVLESPRIVLVATK